MGIFRSEIMPGIHLWRFRSCGNSGEVVTSGLSKNIFTLNENFKSKELALPNHVTKHWNQSGTELRLLAFIAKEYFHLKFMHFNYKMKI